MVTETDAHSARQGEISKMHVLRIFAGDFLAVRSYLEFSILMSLPIPSKAPGTGRCLCLYAISRRTNLTISHPRHAFTRRIHATPLSQTTKKSFAQLRSSIKNSQLERQRIQQEALIEKYKDDPAGAARHMERMNKQAMRAGQDMWANAKMPALGE